MQTGATLSNWSETVYFNAKIRRGKWNFDFSELAQDLIFKTLTFLFKSLRSPFRAI
jgi:hypothetical protein